MFGAAKLKRARRARLHKRSALFLRSATAESECRGARKGTKTGERGFAERRSPKPPLPWKHGRPSSNTSCILCHRLPTVSLVDVLDGEVRVLAFITDHSEGTGTEQATRELSVSQPFSAVSMRLKKRQASTSSGNLMRQLRMIWRACPLQVCGNET